MSRARIAGKSQSTKTCDKPSKPVTNEQRFRDSIRWLMAEDTFQDLKVHGNTGWVPFELCVLTLMWIWSPAKKLTGAFEEACAQSRKVIGSVAVSTYQGLAKALQRWTPKFMPRLQEKLHELMERVGGRHFKMGRWVAIAADGSRSTTPRTVSNEKAFCAKNYGKGQTAKYRKKKSKGMRRRKNERNKPAPQAPQIWITLMWHMGLGLAWCWKLGPSNSSERQHVMDLLQTAHFVKNTLFVMDAGFVGYEFWNAILNRGHHFLVRVGANVRLLTNLGYRTEQKDGIVYCWPQAAMKKKLPPLKLRLVECLVGTKQMCLLTSVLDESQLTPAEVAKLYQQRWGIELEFRCLKQTFERRVLRSRTAARALVELEWSIYAMTVIELFALKEQMLQKSADPHKVSFAQALAAVRKTLQALGNRSRDIEDLAILLRRSLIDSYERKRPKAARYNPHTKTKPSCGFPKITVATAEQRQQFKKVNVQHAA